jgi:hypothetical protein
MFFTAYQAIRGQYLFHTSVDYHNPLVANLIGTMTLTSFASLILLITIWNYQQVEKETA